MKFRCYPLENLVWNVQLLPKYSVMSAGEAFSSIENERDPKRQPFEVK